MRPLGSVSLKSPPVQAVDVAATAVSGRTPATTPSTAAATAARRAMVRMFMVDNPFGSGVGNGCQGRAGQVGLAIGFTSYVQYDEGRIGSRRGSLAESRLKPPQPASSARRPDAWPPCC